MPTKWTDFFKIFSYEGEPDPLSKSKDSSNFTGGGVTSYDALLSSGNTSLRDSNELIDTQSLSNRIMRYKEYDRLRVIPEIEISMNVMTDEACVAGNTKVATPFGFITIQQLAERQADDRFLVYCYDFEQKDYTLGWAYAPRKVKTAPTCILALDDGSEVTLTPDHRVLKKDGQWSEAGSLKPGDELMPFYRLSANQNLTKVKTGQYPRLLSFNRGWVHERQFVDDWKSGHTAPNYAVINKAARLLAQGLQVKQISQLVGKDWHTIEERMRKEGFSPKEIRWLAKNKDRRRVIGVFPGPTVDVYDLSVEKHKCFATESLILHNCQKDEEGNIFKIECKNEAVKTEISFVAFNRKMLNLNRQGPIYFKNLCINGDLFLEYGINPDNPKEGIYNLMQLPPETMYRIETIKGKLVEFQQSKDGPDHDSVLKGMQIPETINPDATKAIRFAPNQIVHFRIGDDRKAFYPYGQSLIEPARGPAHQLRMMEDAMVVYRLVRAPERRIFYVDVGQLSNAKAESFLDQLKNQFRKRKTGKPGVSGANAVEERWQPPAADEDYWMPIRPNSQTRIETLDGAQNLGEIDDAIYFRNKLMMSLGIPKNYLSNEDPGATRITLSAQDVKFARMIERLQGHFEDGLLQIIERHLELRGFPEDSYADLKIKMTPPSDWRELSRAEVTLSRYGNASTLKSSNLMADYDIYTKILKYDEEVSQEMIARIKLQKLEDLKLQVLAQNPALLGVGIPGDDAAAGQELGMEPGGPTPNPMDPNAAPPQTDPGLGGTGMPPEPPATQAAPSPEEQPAPSGQQPAQEVQLPEPAPEDIKKYDLELQDYEREMDIETPDRSIGDN